MRPLKRVCLLCLCITYMFTCTACGYISNDKNEKIHDDIPAGNIKNVNISSNARSIVIKQGVTDHFEFYNADLDEGNQYEVEVAYDEDGSDLDILVTMENAAAGNDILGSVVVWIPQKEFECIEVDGEYRQLSFYTLNSDVVIHANDASVIMNLMTDELDHNITLAGSESSSFGRVMVYFDQVPENVRIELNDISQNAINDPSGFLAGDKGKSGAGEPVISIDSADRIDFYVKEE